MPIPVTIPDVPPAPGNNKQFPIRNPDGSIRYPGFTYYPRHPDEKDPPIQPSKVHMVELIKKLKGRPYWEKDTIRHLKLDEEKERITFVPNTPHTNAMLWKVKHLVRITPVTFPQGLPRDGDVRGARIKENGEVVFVPQLKEDAIVAEKQAVAPKDPSTMDTDTLKKYLRNQWVKPWN
nr:EOG090X0EYV [Eulimnadia texana]